jgi:hypothetical protein
MRRMRPLRNLMRRNALRLLGADSFDCDSISSTRWLRSVPHHDRMTTAAPRRARKKSATQGGQCTLIPEFFAFFPPPITATW